MAWQQEELNDSLTFGSSLIKRSFSACFVEGMSHTADRAGNLYNIQDFKLHEYSLNRFYSTSYPKIRAFPEKQGNERQEVGKKVAGIDMGCRACKSCNIFKGTWVEEPQAYQHAVWLARIFARILVKVIPLKLFYYQTFFETWHNEHS